MAKEPKKTKEELEQEFDKLIFKKIKDKNKESDISDIIIKE